MCSRPQRSVAFMAERSSAGSTRWRLLSRRSLEGCGVVFALFVFGAQNVWAVHPWWGCRLLGGVPWATMRRGIS